MATVLNDTPIKFLRRLAERNDMFAYVLPGPEPNQSVGYFKGLNHEPADLEPLILLGKDRNISGFNVDRDHEGPQSVTASSLSFGDKTVVTRTSTFRDLDLLGPAPATNNSGTRRLSPGANGQNDPQARVDAFANRSRYAFAATGSVLPHCYGSLLVPFNVVQVKAGETDIAGNYLIRKVVHQIDRHQHKQDFTVMRDAASAPVGESALLPDIF